MSKPTSKRIFNKLYNLLVHKYNDVTNDRVKSRRAIRTIIAIIALIIILPKLIPYTKKVIISFSPKEVQLFEVDVAVALPSRVDHRIFSTGDILAAQQINLNSEVSGRVVTDNLREGMRVRKGQLLVKLYDKDLQAQHQRASFSLNLAREREARQKQLFDRGGVSQEEYDATVGQVKNLEAEVALVNAEIEKTEIIAPFDGILGLKYITIGSYITPSTRISTLQDIGRVYIDFSIPEKYVAIVQPGDSIFFTVQGSENQFNGLVFAIEPQIDPSTRTVRVRGISDNRDELLRPGMLANIDLILETYENAITLPTISLIPYESGFKVFLYSQGHVIEQQVKTGIRMRNRMHIVKGVNPGDTVLINGLLQVREGTQVLVRNVMEENYE
jgi:membrane fusion protein (multidrug efflux system)